jgi:hypothetical protein
VKITTKIEAAGAIGEDNAGGSKMLRARLRSQISQSGRDSSLSVLKTIVQSASVGSPYLLWVAVTIQVFTVQIFCLGSSRYDYREGSEPFKLRLYADCLNDRVMVLVGVGW